MNGGMKCQAHDYKQVVITKDPDADGVISALTNVKALEKWFCIKNLVLVKIDFCRTLKTNRLDF